MTPVEQIKTRLSVVDVVSGYLKLIKAGSNFKAVCPFHSEKTPSFFISPAREVWHCFGCSRGGDQFRFVMDIEGVDFREALRMLADRAGVELHHEQTNDRNERVRLLRLMEIASQFYVLGLQRFSAVHTYLSERGVTDETIKNFRIGYAPPETSGWRLLSDFALKKGYTPDELIKAGLTIRKQADQGGNTTGYYDRFRNRIIFPITDANGRVVAFGGRMFPDFAKTAKEEGEEGGNGAKYINSPQTMLYDKSRILYAFDKAKVSIRKENACIVVEGYMDAVMAHQAGTTNTVAVSGTALTQQQLTIIRRLCDQLVTSFDMDEAGENATRRSIDLALEIGFDVKAITLPSGKDPADLIKNDFQLWNKAVVDSADIVSFFLTKASGKFDTRTLDGKRGITRSVLPLVARLPREVDKAHWVAHIASRLGVREESLWADLKAEKNTQQYQTEPRSSLSASVPESKSDTQQNRAQILEERILGLLYAYHVSLSASVSEAMFTSENRQLLYRTAVAHKGSHNDNALVVSLGDELLKTYANKLIFETEMLVNRENAFEEYESCIAELQREHIKEKLEQLTGDIQKAEAVGNAQQVAVLVDEFKTLSRGLTNSK